MLVKQSTGYVAIVLASKAGGKYAMYDTVSGKELMAPTSLFLDPTIPLNKTQSLIDAPNPGWYTGLAENAWMTAATTEYVVMPVAMAPDPATNAGPIASEEQSIVGARLDTAERVWTVDVDVPTYNLMPAIAFEGSGNPVVLIQLTNGELKCIELHTGTILWTLTVDDVIAYPARTSSLFFLMHTYRRLSPFRVPRPLSSSSSYRPSRLRLPLACSFTPA